MLKERVLSAVILIPIAFALLYLGGWWFALLVGFFGLMAGHEAYAMLREHGYAPFQVLGLLIIGLFVVFGVWPQGNRWMPFLITGAIMVTLVRALGQRTDQPATDWALTVAIAFYLGMLVRYGPLLRARPNGLKWVVIALLLTWISDSAAYFIGVGIGRHRLAPRLSPKKTWEGTIGEWLAGPLAGAVLVPLLLPPMTVVQGLVLGAAVSTVAPLGDLAESMLKRQCGVKDSGRLIPGHGGALDRIDSLLFVFPVVYAFSLWWG